MKIGVKIPTKSLTITNSRTKSFGKNLLQTPRFMTKTINTVTEKVPKNSYGKGVLDLCKYVPKWRDELPNK